MSWSFDGRNIRIVSYCCCCVLFANIILWFIVVVVVGSVGAVGWPKWIRFIVGISRYLKLFVGSVLRLFDW